MNCKEYAPWVSRYLDEDLEGKELVAFLDHLSGCSECQKEMEAVERLSGWLRAADAHQGIPEIRGEWGLEDLLRRETSSEEIDLAEAPASTAGRVGPEKGRPWSRSK
ncbi:MAG: anti-sigma factor family protein, partial [Thermodesulfobacteriota bacterium]